MRTRQRLMALKKWVYESACKGRMMKTPGRDALGREDITVIATQEPAAFLGFYPSRLDETGYIQNPPNVCPSILISQIPDNVKLLEDQRFDKYQGIHRPQEMGQWLNINMLFSIYEPGIRLPGFVEAAQQGQKDMSKIIEGTEEGVLTLADWMDDLKDQLVAAKCIPGSDLMVEDKSITYGPLIESNYIADKRPIYYGSVNVRFECYSDQRDNNTIDKFLL